MGSIIGWLRNLVQLKILLKSLGGRYGRIIASFVKLVFYSIKLTCISVNYLAALILIPAIVCFITHLISRDYLIPAIVSIIAIVIYLIIMSNYFSKGVHQFGTNAKEIKQMYHTIRMEHKLALKSLRDDQASGRLLVFLAIIIALEFIFLYNLYTRFNWNANIREIIMAFVSVQIIFVLIEYISSGHKIFHIRMPKLKFIKKASKSKETEKPLPDNYVRNNSFDELIIQGEPEEEKKEKKKTEKEEE